MIILVFIGASLYVTAQPQGDWMLGEVETKSRLEIQVQ